MGVQIHALAALRPHTACNKPHAFLLIHHFVLLLRSMGASSETAVGSYLERCRVHYGKCRGRHTLSPLHVGKGVCGLQEGCSTVTHSLTHLLARSLAYSTHTLTYFLTEFTEAVIHSSVHPSVTFCDDRQSHHQ